MVVALAVAVAAACAATAQKPVLREQDLADITRLLMLEDRREFHEGELARILRSNHPEVRRRAVLAVARIQDRLGRSLARSVAADRDTAVAATAVFALGQLRDSSAVPLLDNLLFSASTPPTVAFEAARALGKIRTDPSYALLARYLGSAPESAAAVVGEALLSIGRHTQRGSLAPVLRWTKSGSEEVRWRATWALFRPRDPAAVPELLRLSHDPSGHVRSWAIRGLGAPQVDSAGIGRAAALERLLAAVHDADRRVQTEAIRTLIAYDDSASFDVLVRALDYEDSWLSISAAEALARRTNRRADATAALQRAIGTRSSSALQTVAQQSIRALNPDTSAPARPQGGGGRPPQQRLIDTGRSEADYRRVVERWIVPAYNGAPRPRVEWTTPRGRIELELYAGEAPLATEAFLQLMESNAIVGTAFTRVVPDFVVQQRTIPNAPLLRDAVTRLGLTRGNLSWASAGLDTGRPGYTLGSTPQPHNEGDFTTLGRVVRGMDVVDWIELGDQITGLRIIRRE